MISKKPLAELSLPNIKSVIAVSSGKGGVGKSTITANMATVLSKSGFRVGILDADIYGPSQTNLMGSTLEKDQVLGTEDGKMIPLEKHGIKFISMGALMDEEAPAVWRGPMAQRAVEQFLTLVDWGELDYLLVDLPPGTGDIQLTLAQKSFLSGAIVVTTPQSMATKIAKKGLKMFLDLEVPILGVVENMKGFFCSYCEKTSHIFKKDGGEKLAKDLNLKYLGGVPLDEKLVESSELGVPLIIHDASSVAVKEFEAIVANLIESVNESKDNEVKTLPKEISLTENGGINLKWNNGESYHLAAHYLRTACPCAQCVDETSGEKILDPQKVPLDIKISDFQFVGRYGLGLQFSDHHRTGIYHFQNLNKWGKDLAGANPSEFPV